jgi:hypothetical protein
MQAQSNVISYLLHVDAVTGRAEDETGLHGSCKPLSLDRVRLSSPTSDEDAYLVGDLFLLLSWKVDKVIVLCANQERDGSLVEAASLPVPLLDGV